MEESEGPQAPQTSFCNITATFSGIGSTLVDANSIVIAAIDQYSLDLKACPFQTIYLHFQYVVQNLRRYQLKDLLFFYEETGDLHFDLALHMLNDGSFSKFSGLRHLLENSRIALALCCHKRAALCEHLSVLGLYVGLLDTLIFEVPFIFTLVTTPTVSESAVYEDGESGRAEDVEQAKFDQEKHGFDAELMRREFFDVDEEWEFKDGDALVSLDLVRAVLQHNRHASSSEKIYFDGRILNGLKRSASTDESILSRLDSREEAPRTIFDVKPSRPWSGKDLDLIMPPIPEKISMKHLANIRRSALSLYDGKFSFSAIVRESDRGEKPKKMSTKSLKIIRENEERLRQERQQREEKWLRDFYDIYQKAGPIKARRALLEKTKSTSEFITRRLLLLKIELYAEIWSLERRNEQIDEKVLVPLYLSCLKYIETYVGETWHEDELQFVIEKLVDAKFEATAMEILGKLNIKLKVNFSPGATAAPNDIDLYFQLKYAGDHLKRTLGTRKDRRVPFDPDQWQADLLDAVDANKSAIVAAPTSSGKTFICFYAIEKILRSSDTDMVVFCLPTKALVNQVSADIYARFNTKSVKLSLQGTLMADRCNEPFNCQVLITIPSMLESFLNSRDCSNLKYIIIDEVHKINDAALGLRIERIIHLARCPLLLLSATLGNLPGFYDWFRAIENAKGRECELVYHGERYCELKPYVYTEKRVEEGEAPQPTLVPLNGMFPYSFLHLRKFGFGNDLHFLPEELLNIYLYIYMILEPPQKKLIKDLAPKKFFKSNIICKADVKEYQHHLLSTFRKWVDTGILGEKQVAEIHDLLTEEAHEAFNFSPSETYIVENILQLLNTLRDADALPVIVFNTDRDFISRLARFVFDKLEKMDVKKKYDKALEALKKEAKRSRDVEKTKTSWIEDSIAAEQMVEPDQRDIRYTFLDPLTKLTDYEVKEEFADIKGVSKDFLDMAYRGIGVHHSAMNRKYRSAVEILFRKKHVRVLFATETLALGINMPCRTVVFAGDSLQLDPMNYKQMSGRAGRRGYDTLGNVVFFGVPKHRVQNLMVSMLPEIRGAYAYSNTSLVSFNIEESLLQRPLMAGNDDVSGLQHLSVSSPSPGDIPAARTVPSTSFTLNVLDTLQSRKELVAYQKSIYPHVFPSNYLWDLFVSNREFDPPIFVFGLLFEMGKVKWTPDEFMSLVAHLFEVRAVHPLFQHALGPLYGEADEALSQLNAAYLSDVSRFYPPGLRSLQAQTTKPLFYVKSFLYSLSEKKNSYIFDFYQHGSSYKIRKYNMISEGELWQSLNNVDVFLKNLVILLETYFGTQDERYKRLRMIYAEFSRKFQQIFA